MKTKWLPIETAPKDGTRIILKFTEGVDIGSYIKIDILYATAFGWMSSEKYKSEPTHWLPIPKFEE
jgi:hypothetical protein